MIKPERFSDERGSFRELYRHDELTKKIGKEIYWRQMNKSHSISANTLRGLHFQVPPYAQAKLVQCVRGAIFDVVVDLRSGSPSFGKWQGFQLSSDNCFLLYVPEGFAHGFLTLEPYCEVIYKCSEYYEPEYEGSICWDDPVIDIDWPLHAPPVLSEKDRLAQGFDDFESPFDWAEKV